MIDSAAKSRAPEYFAGLYAEDHDPWNFTASRYEYKKYSDTLAVLENRRFRSGFEIGCSIGVFTKMLTHFCDRLLAIDVAERALVQAVARCSQLDHVKFEQMQVPNSWPDNKEFDLILLSEVLYFLAPGDIALVASRVSQSTVSGGTVLLVNYTEKMDEPCGGNQAAEIFIRCVLPGLQLKRHIRCPKFRIDELKRV